MLIPKDATIFIAVWALHNSEHQGFQNPKNFDPDRFLKHPQLASCYAASPEYRNRDKYIYFPLHGEMIVLTTFIHHYAYGSGRRICPGIQLAERVLWRAIANIIWAFEISEHVDSVTGTKTPLDVDAYTMGLVHSPLPFKISITPRSLAHVDKIQQQVRKAMESLDAWI
jgi:cytochrome P450